MKNRNEFKENLIKMANLNKNEEDKNQMKKIGDNARKVIKIIERGEK